jgi:hypothetical protein
LFRDIPESGFIHLPIRKYTDMPISLAKFNIMLNKNDLKYTFQPHHTNDQQGHTLTMASMQWWRKWWWRRWKFGLPPKFPLVSPPFPPPLPSPQLQPWFLLLSRLAIIINAAVADAVAICVAFFS